MPAALFLHVQNAQKSLAAGASLEDGGNGGMYCGQCGGGGKGKREKGKVSPVLKGWGSQALPARHSFSWTPRCCEKIRFAAGSALSRRKVRPNVNFSILIVLDLHATGSLGRMLTAEARTRTSLYEMTKQQLEI